MIQLAYIAGAHFQDIEFRHQEEKKVIFVSPTHDRKTINRAWKYIEKKFPNKRILFICKQESKDTFLYRIEIV